MASLLLQTLLSKPCCGEPAVAALLWQLYCGNPNLALLLCQTCHGKPVVANLQWQTCCGKPAVANLLCQTCCGKTVMETCRGNSTVAILLLRIELLINNPLMLFASGVLLHMLLLLTVIPRASAQRRGQKPNPHIHSTYMQFDMPRPPHQSIKYCKTTNLTKNQVSRGRV